MLARARKTIKKLDEYNHDHVSRTCKSRRLTLKLVHKITRDSVMQKLDLIRIRLLRLQLDELRKIKSILEKKIKEQAEERRELDRRHELDQQRELDHERQIEEQQQKIDSLLMNPTMARPQARAMSPKISAADSTFIRQDSENLAPSVYNTPDEEKAGKDSRYSTIDEEERDDLIPDIETPPRNYPRQSIGQWSVERAKNNLSVRSLISSLEDKTGARGFARSRMMK